MGGEERKAAAAAGGREARKELRHYSHYNFLARVRLTAAVISSS
jgi:hypothetical protein